MEEDHRALPARPSTFGVEEAVVVKDHRENEKVSAERGLSVPQGETRRGRKDD